MANRITLDLEDYEGDLGELTPSELVTLERRYRVAIVKLLRQRALPVIRANSPRRSGKLARGYRLRSRKGAVILHNSAFYWHLQTTASGERLPEFVDKAMLEVVRAESSDLLRTLIADLVGARE